MESPIATRFVVMVDPKDPTLRIVGDHDGCIVKVMFDEEVVSRWSLVPPGYEWIGQIIGEGFLRKIEATGEQTKPQLAAVKDAG